MLIKPLHIATIRGHQLRFYRTPNEDGRPDMPWHSVDDLAQCFGASRSHRRAMFKQLRACGFKTIATADGIVTIAPHFAAQGAIAAAQACIGGCEDIDRAYCFEGAIACQKLTAGPSFNNGLLEWMKAAVHRHDDVTFPAA